jgi:ankyrin repeat protein
MDIETELLIASSEGNLENVTKLLMLYGDALSEGPIYSEYILGYALRNAACNGHTEIVKIFLDFSVNVDSESIDGVTALMKASGFGHTDTVKILLDTGADVNAQDNGGMTPLYYAMYKGTLQCVNGKSYYKEKDEKYENCQVVSLLLAAGAKTIVKLINRTCNLLVEAVAINRVNTVRLFLDAGVNANGTQEYGIGVYEYAHNTPLSVATYKGSLELVKMLLEYGADVDAKVKELYVAQPVLMSILRIACLNNINKNPKIVVTLLDAGADSREILETRMREDLDPDMVRIVAGYRYKFLLNIIDKDMFETICQFI